MHVNGKHHANIAKFITVVVLINLHYMTTAIVEQTAVISKLNNILKDKIPNLSFIENVAQKDKQLDKRNNFAWLNLRTESKTASKEMVWKFNDLLGFEENQILCIHRWKVWWAIPKLLKGVSFESSAPPETLMLIGKLKSSSDYLLLIPVINQHTGFSLEGTRTNAEIKGNAKEMSFMSLTINAQDNSNQSNKTTSTMNQTALLIGMGPNPFNLLRNGFEILSNYLRIQLGTFSSMKMASKESPISEDNNQMHSGLVSDAHRILSRFQTKRGPGPAFVDFFGWCSWDSFYTDVSEDGILHALQSFADLPRLDSRFQSKDELSESIDPIETLLANPIPRFMILDDGWQNTNVDNRMNGYQWGGQLASFNANFKFKEGYSRDGDKLDAEEEGRERVGVKEPQQYIPSQRSKMIRKAETTCSSSSRKETVGATPGEGFSLSKLVRSSKEKHFIKHLLVWHTLTGYWAGVVPKAATTTTQSSSSVCVEDDKEKEAGNGSTAALGEYNSVVSFPHITQSMYRMAVSGALDNEPFTTHGVGVIDPSMASKFFDQYHENLKKMGVDGVKVDAQSILPSLVRPNEDLEEVSSGWKTAAMFHQSLKSSVQRHFGSVGGQGVGGDLPIIHCMCHSQGTLFSILAMYQLPPDPMGKMDQPGRRVPVVRGSDDYWPIDDASHGPHVYANAMNSLIISYLGLHDWDMFQTRSSTDHRCSRLHAATRAISGGPVYVSDKPHEQDVTILRQLAFSDGRVPRCIRSARPVERMLFLDPQREVNTPLLVQNINPGGGLVVGAFNVFGSVLENDLDGFRFIDDAEVLIHDDVRTDTIDGSVSPYDVEETLETMYWLTDRSSATMNPPMSRSNEEGIEDGIEDGIEVIRLQDGGVVLGILDSQWISQTDFIAFSYATRKLSRIRMNWTSSESDSVAIHLDQRFGFDIVSFAPMHHWSQSRHNSTVLLTDPVNGAVNWISMIGAVDTFNPGGAVLSIDPWTHDETVEREVFVDLELMGTGRFVGSTSYSKATITSILPSHEYELLGDASNRKRYSDINMKMDNSQYRVGLTLNPTCTLNIDAEGGKVGTTFEILLEYREPNRHFYSDDNGNEDKSCVITLKLE